MTTARFHGPSGSLIFIEHSDALPLFQCGVTLRSGSTFDPPGQEGLCRMAARMWRMGTAELSAEALEDRIDAMGAHLSIGVGRAYTHIGGTVVARNLERFLSLLADLLQGPAFRSRDLGQQQRETIAALESSLDDDSAIAGRHFRRLALAGHAYGRPVAGTRASVAAIDRDALVAHMDRHLTGPNVLLGLSGPLTPEAGRALLEKYFSFLPDTPAPSVVLPEPRFAPGRRLYLVDKPDRTQTQVIIGTTGTISRDPDHVPLVVANTAFGGLFTSRVTTEVRAKRGWSYSASSGLGHQPHRDLWSMRTAPAEKDAYPCVELQLRLLEEWIEHGVSGSELELAKSYLIKSHPFESDTAHKRLEHAMDQVLFDVPEDVHNDFPGLVGRVDRAAAHEAVRARISNRDQVIVVVGTAAQVGGSFERLPGIDQLEILPFDSDW